MITSSITMAAVGDPRRARGGRTYLVSRELVPVRCAGRILPVIMHVI
jgi:hypothetical protein